LSDSIKKADVNTTQLTQMELKRNFEKGLEDRVQQLLEKIYGPNKVVTMITANLDFNQKEADRTLWGNQGVVESEQTSQTGSSSSSASGIVGDTNRDPTIQDTQGTNNSGMNVSSTKNYEINKVQEKEIYAPGRVISISTAVAINGALPTDAEMRVKDIVSAAIGFSAARGDTLNIVSTDFDQSSLDTDKADMAKAEADAQKNQQINNYISWGWKGIGILVLLILGVALVRLLNSMKEREIVKHPISVKQVEAKLEQLEMNKNSETQSQEGEKIKGILKHQPEIAAQIITSWLDESGSEVSG